MRANSGSEPHGPFGPGGRDPYNFPRVGRTAKIIAGVVVALLIALAVSAYAWDASREDQIAEGVRIGNVDVGGMSSDEAGRSVQRRVVEPLERPVTVTYDGIRYVLHPDHLDVRADVAATVDAALEASREASLPSRVWRDVTGGEVDETIQPQITYSSEAVDNFIANVAAEVNREPVNATIEPTPTSLNVVPGEAGVTLQEDELRQQVEAAIRSPDNRKLAAQVEEVAPEVTTDQLAAEYPTYLTVDRSGFQLRLWQNLELTQTYPIAVGAVGWETPSGVYNIENMAVDPAWSVPEWGGSLAGQVIPGGSPENPLKARWMGIYDGAGIHGTDDIGSLGTAASHGCIRMAIPDVIELYDQVDVGTPIYIG
jgi:lipoprotein-anchoring transpeptidase ErfK/SrfK